MNNFTRDSLLDLSKRRRVHPTARQLLLQSVRPGDVLFNSTNSPELVGKSALIRELDEPAVFSNHFLRLRTDPELLDPAYLAHFLRQQFSRGVFRAMTKAWVNQATVGRDRLESVSVPLPPLSEQRRIAGILDAADTLRTKRLTAITHLDELPRSLYLDLFGDAPQASTVAAESSRIRTGPFGSQLLHSEFAQEGVAVLGLDNVVGNTFQRAGRRYITPEKYETLSRYTVYPGDVLISIMGTTGRCVIVPDDIGLAINTKHICAISPDILRIDPAFLRATFLWNPKARAYLLRHTKGAIMDGLNMGIIRAMPLPVPPLPLQHEFADRVRAIEAQRARAECALAVHDELFASLQSRAFRGEL